MDFILENLAIGNCREALAPASDINALLCVATEHDIYDTKYKYFKVPIADMQPIPTGQLKDAIVWLRSNIEDNRILVFCNAGIGRSPSVVVGKFGCALVYLTSKTWSSGPGQNSMALPVNMLSGVGVLEYWSTGLLKHDRKVKQ